ncbi:High-affinity branched-chain amino acid transport system permease protein LivH [Baekduia alba]|uniref:branched-chain amino acid ABC transporter permease n=1 Tax=Baekduia alba TaxID=2997333 RepID=UPI0023406F0B|nr:branched-chain amino acid ABC transporter permease [Baekduia alba]WCB95270.1 High-affinity branched-chain amino acid transport system permease protein LivH [Baekduia alba]
MPDFKPFIVSGLALGAIYSLSGVGIVLLLRTSGVLNLAHGALGAASALTCWQLLDDGNGEPLAIAAGVVVAAALAAGYGLLISPRLAGREPVVQAASSLGFALAVLGGCLLIWGEEPRTLDLSTSLRGFFLGEVHVNTTQVIALCLGLATTLVASIVLRATRVGVAMRSLACDRELSALLGVRVRRTEALAWTASGALAGLAGILLASLVRLEPYTLTFLVIASLAAAVLGGLRSLYGVFAGGLLIGVLQACATPVGAISTYRDATPFVVAIVAMLALYARGQGAATGGRQA